MGGKILGALLNVISKNPALLEQFAEAFISWATEALKKAAADAKAPPAA